MTVFAVEGAAGCGKTYRLMQALGESLALAPLREGQRVLALTFMHGARRRLHDRLASHAECAGRFVCSTVDAFARRLLGRWRGLAAALGVRIPAANEFEAQCDAAGLLIERPEVGRWIAASFPVVVVDEAQDLRPERLRIVAALARHSAVLVAADEFQCLDQALRPNPGVAWLRAACAPEALAVPRRTRVPGLLAAAAAIRAGGQAQHGSGYKVLAARGAPMAASYLANAIAWARGGDVAVITPSLAGGMAADVVGRVCRGACGTLRNGPFAIAWDGSDAGEAEAMMEGFELGGAATLAEAVGALGRLPVNGVLRETIAWARRQSRTGAMASFSRADVLAAVTRRVTVRRQRFGAGGSRFVAMTVQQAKNREFDGVVVLWPFQVGGDAEHKRRLLYNAVTRARRWCTVVLQGEALLRSPPFA